MVAEPARLAQKSEGRAGNSDLLPRVLSALVLAPLAILVYTKLKEPDAWLEARSQKKRMGSFADLFSDPRWRRNSGIARTLGGHGRS